jgi:hypothetical protein
MPILLWYLPFTMFSGACDLVFSELEAQAGGERTAELGEPAWDAEDAGQ